MINHKTHPIYNLLRDFYINIVPAIFVPKRTKRYHYCFLGHPRDYNEIYRKFPFFRKFPTGFLRFLTKYLFWPTTISDIEGLRNISNNKEVKGCVISIPMIPVDLLENRDIALKKIRKAVLHAKKQGVKIVGLAGYISSLSKGGVDLIDMDISFTTGHAYTTLNIVRNYFAFLEKINIPHKYKDITIAIVGAAGSVGSSVAKYLADKGIKKIILIDLERKIKLVEDLKSDLSILNSEGEYIATSEISSLKKAPIVFTTTNASEALITEELCVPGTVFIDDTHPKDISKNVHFLKEVLVLEAGVVHTPGVTTHFNFGLKNKNDNFCCMAELLALSSVDHKGNYVVNRPSLDQVNEIAILGDNLGFKVGEFQNFYGTINPEIIENVGNLLKKRILEKS